MTLRDLVAGAPAARPRVIPFLTGVSKRSNSLIPSSARRWNTGV
jgi:hypothetical protein